MIQWRFSESHTASTENHLKSIIIHSILRGVAAFATNTFQFECE